MPKIFLVDVLTTEQVEAHRRSPKLTWLQVVEILRRNQEIVNCLSDSVAVWLQELLDTVSFKLPPTGTPEWKPGDSIMLVVRTDWQREKLQRPAEYRTWQV